MEIFSPLAFIFSKVCVVTFLTSECIDIIECMVFDNESNLYYTFSTSKHNNNNKSNNIHNKSHFNNTINNKNDNNNNNT